MQFAVYRAALRQRYSYLKEKQALKRRYIILLTCSKYIFRKHFQSWNNSRHSTNFHWIRCVSNILASSLNVLISASILILLFARGCDRHRRDRISTEWKWRCPSLRCLSDSKNSAHHIFSKLFPRKQMRVTTSNIKIDGQLLGTLNLRFQAWQQVFLSSTQVLKYNHSFVFDPMVESWKQLLMEPQLVCLQVILWTCTCKIQGQVLS